MNDSPGWAAPGSSSPEPDPADPAHAENGSGAEAEKAQGTPGDDTEHTTSPIPPQSPPNEPADQRPPNWAPEQPPAAPRSWTWGSQSGTPTAGQGPQPGYGPTRGRGWGPTPPPPGGPGPRQPGWHSGWAQQPQPPKPGVVPLRPLGVGEVLDGSVSTMRAHWRTVLGISLAVAVITEVVAALVMGLWLNDTSELDALANNDNPSLDELNNALSGMLSSLAVVAVVGMLGSVIATAMLTVVVSRAVLGRSVTLGEAWRDSRPQLLRLLGLLILIPLLVSVAMAICLLPGLLVSFTGVGSLAIVLLFFGFLGGIVAAVWMWVRFCLAPPALMLEKQGLIAAMRRSGKLVSGSWWRILGIQLLAFVLVTAISFVVSIPTTALTALVSGGTALTDTAAATGWTSLIINGIGSVVASTISLPLNAGITALLYLDQRIRREALDLELARAAGVPGYEFRDTEPPAPGS
ncbi:hypothetical protein MMF93_13175 [Streptomyces tubbatahanensis]|uniref:DUF7847 domain-containing protein n=1 Tax=Streptomyces tubbatahanensis TaxID=2923272 RepID=A0ABY3XS88_9ACTN|nr:hypothetical protein [Streptomyces tubbatahanensis]UNS97346.1 hypothetical protein MMF93_13175 [Streptomyces tubbatahanensis]